MSGVEINQRSALTLSAPTFRRYLSSALFFKQTINRKEVYLKI